MDENKTQGRYTVVFDGGYSDNYQTLSMAKMYAEAGFKHFKELRIDGEVIYNRFSISNGSLSLIFDYDYYDCKGGQDGT